MEILVKSKMPNGTKIQIEDWSNDFSHYAYGSSLAAYPMAIASSADPFGPYQGKTFRCNLEFENYEETKQAFAELESGAKELKDFKANMRRPEDIKYIPHNPQDTAIFDKKNYYRSQLELAETNKIWITSLNVAYEVDCIFSEEKLSEQDFEKACELIELAYMKTNVSVTINTLTNSLHTLLTRYGFKLEEITIERLIDEEDYM